MQNFQSIILGDAKISTLRIPSENLLKYLSVLKRERERVTFRLGEKRMPR